MPEYDYTDPKQTVEHLKWLKCRGFDDEAFGIVHQFGDGTTIASHIAHCEKVGHFTRGPGGNPDTQQRLEMIRKAYEAVPFTKGAKLFKHLAEATAIELPPVKAR